MNHISIEGMDGVGKSLIKLKEANKNEPYIN